MYPHILSVTDLVCPKLEPFAIGTCGEACQEEGCPEGELCCSNGCGHTCQKGVRPSDPDDTNPCKVQISI